MEKYQMKAKYFIPLFLLLGFSVSILLVFLIPTSRYTYLSGLDESMLGYVPFIASIGEIVLLGLLIALAILELFTSKLFLYRLELTFDLILFFFSYVLEILFVCFQKKDFGPGMPFFVPLILYTVFFVLCIITSFFFVYKPFHKIEEEAKKIQKRWEKEEEAEKAEKQKKVSEELSDIDSKEKMKAFLKEKYESGELSKEKYMEFLIDLDTNSKE